MDNVVWNKTVQFLKELRCENTGRDSYLKLPEFKIASEEKARCRKEYEKAIHKVAEEEHEKIQQYMDSIEKCAEEENQQAYLQGIVDSMMILSGIGLLQPEDRIMDIIQYLK